MEELNNITVCDERLEDCRFGDPPQLEYIRPDYEGRQRAVAACQRATEALLERISGRRQR